MRRRDFFKAALALAVSPAALFRRRVGPKFAKGGLVKGPVDLSFLHCGHIMLRPGERLAFFRRDEPYIINLGHDKVRFMGVMDSRAGRHWRDVVGKAIASSEVEKCT